MIIFLNPNNCLQKTNKMKLLQSQAPVDQELSGSSARYRTLDIGHQTWDMGHINLEILKRSYFQRGQNEAQAFPQYWNFFKIFK